MKASSHRRATTRSPRDDQAPEASSPQNPLEFAAERMARLAIKASKIDLGQFLSPGSAMIFEVESRSWVDPVAEALKGILPSSDYRLWVVSTGSGLAWSGSDFDGDVVDSLLDGKQIIGVTSDTRRLPSDLVRASDCIIKIPPPSWLVVRDAAASVGLTSTERVPDSECVSLEPGDLRLALRPGGENGVWVQRIRGYSSKSHNITDPVEPAKSRPLDQLADAMVGRALSSSQALANHIETSGMAFVFEVPSAGWTSPIEQALRRSLNVAEAADETDENYGLELDESAQTSDTETVRLWMVRDGSNRDHKADNGNDKVSETLAAGGSVIGIAPTARVLPSDLFRAADHVVRVLPPDWPMIQKIVAAATGNDPSATLPDSVCRSLSPSDFQVSMRSGETANQWISRLKKIGETLLGGSQSGPKLQDLHGMDEATAWGQSLALDLAEYSAGRLSWSAVDRGCLMVGPPGTGKTTFARALARSCDVPLVAGSLAEWQAYRDGHLGDCLKAMRTTFEQARTVAPCILFVDEIDGFGDRDKFPDRHADYSTQVVNCFLEQLDGVSGREGVVVVGASNKPDRLDPAIVRSGRLDRTIRIMLPNEAALAGILRHHLGDELSDADLTSLARRALGMSGADIERIVRGAKRRARTEDRAVSVADLLSEVSGGDGFSLETLRRRAFHEAGHAVAFTLLFPSSVICAVVRTGEGIGGMVETSLPSIMTRSEALRRIMAMLAGRAAEHLMTGAPSSGAGGSKHSDLAHVTTLATSYFSSYGLEDGSLLWMGGETTDDALITLRSDASVRRRVAALIAEQYQSAFEMLSRYRPAIQIVADTLIRARALSGAEITTILESAVNEGGGWS